MEVLFEGEESVILKEFCGYVLKNDPDILISTYQGLERNTIDHLLTRMRVHGLDLGRDCRVCLDSNSFHLDLDLPALIINLSIYAAKIRVPQLPVLLERGALSR